MSDNDHSNGIEERVKKLETLQRNTRIAIIILVGYSIYDVISKDSGSEIMYAHKVKAKEFELVDGIGTVFGTWKLLDVENRAPGLAIINANGEQVHVTGDEIRLLEGRANPTPRVIINKNGLVRYESADQEPGVAE